MLGLEHVRQKAEKTWSLNGFALDLWNGEVVTCQVMLEFVPQCGHVKAGLFHFGSMNFCGIR